MTISWVDIHDSVSFTADEQMTERSIVVLRSGSNDHIYAFYIASSDIHWKKSTDGGATWGSEQTIEDTLTWDTIMVWYDQWTPNDTTGTIIHIIGMDSGNDEAYYFGIDTSDDSTVTNNNTKIVASIGAIVSGDSHPSICKATNGDLYVCWTTDTTTPGVTIYQSTDDGATWTAVYERTEWNDDADDDGDIVRLYPLKTGDDILAVFLENVGNEWKSNRYDQSLDTWGNELVAATGIFGSAATMHNSYSGCVDDNGDLFFAFSSGSSGNTNIEIMKYDESADSWSSPVEFHDMLDSSVNNTGEISFISMSYDATDGMLYVIAPIGEVLADTVVYMTSSQDGGVTWGDWVQMSTTQDDWQAVFVPAVIRDTATKLVVSAVNDDLTDWEIVSGGVDFVRKTGNVKDDAGNNEESVECHAFRLQTTSHQVAQDSHIYLGKTETDASGNYTFVLIDHHNDSPNFQILFNKEGATDADDQTDASRTFSS